MRSEEVESAGLRCIRVIGDEVQVDVTTEVGPRILGFTTPGSRSPFASLPGLSLPGPGGRPYRLRGGHRLWRAPEVPAKTYVPDDGPVAVTETVAGVVVTQPRDASGVARAIELTFLEGGRVRVDHELSNHAAGDIRVAPWAITQLRPGGDAMVPLGGVLSAGDPQANRSLVLWPYTQLDDPGIEVTDSLLTLSGTRSQPAKAGTALERGWLGYRLEDTLFVKRADHRRDAAYADLGASGQCYVGEAFVELETLGPLTTLGPGESVRHTERWELRRLPHDESRAPLMALASNLDALSGRGGDR